MTEQTADNGAQTQSIINMLLEKVLNPQELVKKYDSIKMNRSAWDTKWQLIQDQVFPDYRDYLNRSSNKSSPATSKIKNHSSAVSGKINKVVSLLSSQITDPSVKWLDLKFGEDSLSGHYAVQYWLDSCKESLYKLFSDPESNFYPSTYSFHLDWYTLGTACREVILRKDSGRIKFNTIPMQNIYIDVNGYGDPDTIYRMFQVTAKQAYDIWGENIHPSQLQLAQKNNQAVNARKFEYVEVSMPNPLSGKMPMLGCVSCVIDKTNKRIVDIGLHHSSPYIVSRFFISPGEIYGRSYVWNAMPDIIAINKLSKRVLQGIDFATLPVNLVQDANSLNMSQITPGSFIQGLDAHGRPTIQPMQFGGNPGMALEFYHAKLNDLDEALVARDIFGAENPNMTATEVNERKIQASNRLRPVLVRLEKEDLNRTVIRSLELLNQVGKIPPFPYDELKISPEELPNPLSQLGVCFSGQMARMQRMQEIQSSDLLFQKTLQAAQVDQSVLDRVNLDALISMDAEIYGVSPKVLNSDKSVQQIREERAKQQQAQQQVQQESATLDNIIKLKDAGINATA